MLDHLLYKVTHSARLKKLPGMRRVRVSAEKYLSGKRFRRPYLEGFLLVSPVLAMQNHIYNGRLYEPEIITLIRAFINAGFSYVDIGANVGIHTVGAALQRKSPDQIFWAFEPEPGNYAELRANLDVNRCDFVQTFQLGLGDKTEQLSFHVSDTLNRGKHSFIDRSLGKASIQVSVVPFDQVVQEQRLDMTKPFLFKIDVEGFEPKVIQGARTSFAAMSNAIVLMEISPPLWKQLNYTTDDIFNIMHSLGFDTHFAVREPNTSVDGEYYNCLFVKGERARQALELPGIAQHIISGITEK